MKLFTNASREHLVDIIEEFIDQTFEKYDGSISDVISEFYAVGFTRQEILDVLNRCYLDSYEWAEEETEVAPTPIEEVSVGDSDQAILETALTQIGIPYTWKTLRNGDGGWINLKITENPDSTAAMIYFTKDGTFEGTA